MKSQLIQSYARKIGPKISVFDLCGGKGGDIFKWKKQKIAHYVLLDLSKKLVEEGKSRFEDGGCPYPSIFLVGDAADLIRGID